MMKEQTGRSIRDDGKLDSSQIFKFYLFGCDWN